MRQHDDWWHQAACVGHWPIFKRTIDLDDGKRTTRDWPVADRAIIAKARAICHACPVLDQCAADRDNGQRNQNQGMRAGQTLAEIRLAERRAARIAAAGDTPAAAALGAAASAPTRRPTLPKASRGPQPQHGNERSWKRGCRCAECVAYHDDRIARQRARRADARTQRPTTKTPAVVIDITTRRRHAAADAMDLTGS